VRILIGLILIAVIGGIVAAAVIFRPVPLSSTDLTQVKSTCTDCHSVPVIRSAVSVHAAHTFVNCTVCHTGGTTARVDFNSCIPCHSVPAYTSVSFVHDAHSTTECITCHSDTPGLAAANTANNTLKWVGIGLAGLAVLGLMLNYGVAKFRLRKRSSNGK
jgi:hypothetical protein